MGLTNHLPGRKNWRMVANWCTTSSNGPACVAHGACATRKAPAPPPPCASLGPHLVHPTFPAETLPLCGPATHRLAPNPAPQAGASPVDVEVLQVRPWTMTADVADRWGSAWG